MKAKFIQYVYNIQSSYWFIPMLMALAAILLAIITGTMDRYLDSDWPRHFEWLEANRPEGARSVLATIAGSMITVAGVTFSMTMVSVSFGSAQFGPRLVGNFMRDRGNQITLGTFIATFVYCLMILRTVRSGVESTASAEAVSAFVPHISVLCGLLLALASVAVLIYFIHHIPETIHIGNITADVGKELRTAIDKLFPARVGEPPPEDDSDADVVSLPDDFLETAAGVRCRDEGYIQALDMDGLLKAAIEFDLIVRLEYRPGDFVTKGKSLILAGPADNLTSEAESELYSLFALGSERTPTQNILFLVDELVEIIGRALSPGINDPFTANTCIDWLESALREFLSRQSPPAFRYDSDQRLRVVAYPVSPERFASAIFDQTRPYVASDRNSALHMMKMIAEMASDLEDKAHRDLLLRHARALMEAGQVALALDIDREQLERRYLLTKRLAENPSLADRLRDDQGWLGGHA